MAAARIRIIGLGNPLMADDGLGIRTIQLLQQEKLPASVELIDGGCGGLKLLPLLSGCKQLIIVDAADFNAAPGSVRILNNADLYRLPEPAPQQSGHNFSLSEILHVAQKINPLPPLNLYLMQIKSCHPDLTLTEEVNAALPSLLRTLVRHLEPA